MALPLIGSYLGADTAAAVVASGMAGRRELSLLMDLGTNGEIVLGNRDRLLACSTAAGPALEGANLSCGVLARDGAITDFKAMTNDECRMTNSQSSVVSRSSVSGLRYTVRGGGKPVGFCGSAVVKLLSELVARGLVEAAGRIAERKSILLVPAEASGTGRDILLSQADIRELQLAKAAIAAGVRNPAPRSRGRERPTSGGSFSLGCWAASWTAWRRCASACSRNSRTQSSRSSQIWRWPEPSRRCLNRTASPAFAAAARMTREVLLGSHPEFNAIFVENLGLRPWA